MRTVKEVSDLTGISVRTNDDNLKGDNKMDFEVFNRDDMEKLYESIMANMPEEQKQDFMISFVENSPELSEKEKNEFKEHGVDPQRFRQLFIKSASDEKTQKNFEKVLEWYGDKESAMKAGTNPQNPQIIQAYQNRLNEVVQKIADKRGADVTSFEVKQLIGEYEFVAGQLYQMKDMKAMLLDLAELYTANEKAIASVDQQYGEGTAEFFAKAVKEFYISK